MKIFISGGSGFVGSYIASAFLENGHEVTSVGTSEAHALNNRPGFTYISADTTQPGAWQKEPGKMDVIINLTGRTIFKRWNKPYKEAIYGSRILTTRNIVESLPENDRIVLLSASAAGYYGNRGDERLTEESHSGDDFLAHVCVDWEQETFSAGKKGTRAVAMRFGVILGENGGAYAMMRPIFNLGLGGPTGSGSHFFPWMHIDDLQAAINFIIETPDLKGPINFTSPTPVRNKEFAKEMGKALGRPVFLPAPAFMIKLAMGELGDALLSSQQAVPEKLMQAGFQFQYPTLHKALAALTNKN